MVHWEAWKLLMLLHYTGEEINDIFETLPDTGEENNYQAAIDALNAHFAPTANSEFSIYCFRQAKQQPNETLDTFHTRLQQLAMPCSFTDNGKEVKTQIIQACTSHKLRRSALQHPEWSLSNLLSSGRAMELANKHAADIEQPLEALSVNRIHAKQMHEHSNNPRNGHWTPTQTGKTCYFCGDKYPHTSHCPAKSKKCGNCGKLNHFSRVCRSKPQQQLVQHVYTTPHCDHCSPSAMQHNLSDDSDVFTLHKGHLVHSVYKELPSASVIVHGTAITALIDSGASVNLLDEQDFKALKKPPPLKRDTTIIKAYGIKEPLNTLGVFTTEVESTSKIACADFHVVHGNTGSILSYHTARELGLIHITNTIATSPSTAAELVHKYDHLFHGISKIKDHAVKLYIDKSISPVAQPHRRIPFHQRKKVEDELQRQQDLDIIEEVDGPTPWVSPIVVVPKPKNPEKIRICVDMRAPNTAIRREHHITPTVDDIVAQLHRSTAFSKLDLNHGYHQIELAPESRYITTFSTHVGLRCYKRLSFGVCSAAEIFQNAIGEILHDIPGTLNISDDILVHGVTTEQHNESLTRVFQALSDQHVTLNKEKCEFNKSSVEFFGHIFSKDGVAPDPKKVSAIKNAVVPKDRKEVASLLGLANYCSRYIPNFATVVTPLRKLTHQGEPWH